MMMSDTFFRLVQGNACKCAATKKRRQKSGAERHLQLPSNEIVSAVLGAGMSSQCTGWQALDGGSCKSKDGKALPRCWHVGCSFEKAQDGTHALCSRD
jgi:hypothetical protein